MELRDDKCDIFTSARCRHAELGVESVCCLLHNLIAGGSARQWINLLGAPRRGRRPGDDRRAGRAALGRRRGWPGSRPSTSPGPTAARRGPRRAAAPRSPATTWRSSTGTTSVMDAFEPALEACGRVGAHPAPGPGSARRAGSGPRSCPAARAVVERALADPRRGRPSSAASGTGERFVERLRPAGEELRHPPRLDPAARRRARAGVGQPAGGPGADAALAREGGDRRARRRADPGPARRRARHRG